MLENQEPQENQEPELTVEQKLEQIVCMPRNLLEVSGVTVKPILDVLGLEVKGTGLWGNEPNAEQVTIRQELTRLNRIVTDKENALVQRRNEVSDFRSKVSELEEYLDENWDNIDEDLRDKLCEIFNIEQEVTKTVTISITGTIDITAPRGYDWDNIENDIDPCVEVNITDTDLEQSGYGFSHDDTTIEVD